VSLDHLDPDILNDFITESSELIEQLDQDLVQLESHAEDLDLLNSIFRALHTIKGSGSFLGLDPLTEFAHAAEDALNVLRKGEVKVTTLVMDLMLAAADVIRGQIDELGGGQMPSPGPKDLIDALHKVASDTAAQPDEGEAPDTPAAEPDTPLEGGTQKLELPENKRDLLPFMVEDLKSSLSELLDMFGGFEPGTGSQENDRFAEAVDELARSVEFFEMAELSQEIAAIQAFVANMTSLDADAVAQARPRIEALVHVGNQRAEALEDELVISRPTQTLIERLTAIGEGKALGTEAQLPDHASIQQVLELDGVAQPETPQLAIADPDAPTDASATTAPPDGELGAAPRTGGRSTEANDKTQNNQANQSIRVDVERLESLLNLVGELILQKNRILSLSRKFNQIDAIDHETNEEVNQVASDLDRVTGELQMGVMKTRMQPLSKLFSRYPRVIRDLARMTDKKIQLEMSGGDTEVDKSVMECLGDPLVHILRNSCDHGIETPDKRVAAGKSESGTIWLSAAHEGNNVKVQIRDDGGGINPEVIGRKAVEKGVITADELATMGEKNILQLIFAAGFSTADQVSDLSGRGVGMDVVRTNINKMNGVIDIDSAVGEGTTISVKIPLTVAIMPAMMVGVDLELYAVPLSNIIEIVKPEADQLSTVNHQRVMRLRDTVLPLVDLSECFAVPGERKEAPFAVVVGLGEQRAGLLVHRLIGQQEVVIKPLDDMFDRSGPISGATVREDGGVSMIIDIAALMELVARQSRAAA